MSRSTKRRTKGFTIIELMIIVAILGIIASTAIPSFVKYLRRASTVEATMNLRRMFDGASAYFVADHATATGAPVSRCFPGDAGPTPATIPPGIKVVVAPALWGTPEWDALIFAVNDPQRFSYSFTQNNLTGTSAFGTMTAQGDLDGDGIPSTFSRTIQGVTEGVRGGSGIHVYNEIE